MKTTRCIVAACAALAAMPGWALTDIQVGPSGKTYASAGPACALHPSRGFAPMVMAGLYNPRRGATATVSVDGSTVASLSLASPDATVWLPPAAVTVTVALNRRVADRYAFDATPLFPGQANVCLPDTRGNSVAGELEYAASGKSSASVRPGCALNPATGRAQPFVNLFDNGAWLLNVSVNGVALTQLDGVSRTHAPVFLAPGLNAITAANAALSLDGYVRDGGSGSCALP